MQEPSDFDKLVLSGVVEPAALDPDTGEMLYTFNKDLENINPELHKLVLDNFISSAMKLWELGFINMDVTLNNPMVSLTSRAFDETNINELDEDMQFSLKEIKRNLIQ
ncbi:MAG: hypothetical protein RL348_1308 [Bacteroidota bacterium]|jgi:hypothetical protein